MKAVILAAGRGSRLKGFTEDRPKCLNEVNGRGIIEWQISILKSGGVDEIVIVTGYRANKLDKYKVKTIYNEKWETTNMVSSLLCASEEFNQRLIVSYSDILYSADVVLSLTKQNADAVVVYDTNWKELWDARFDDPLNDAESFKVDQVGYVKDIGRRVTQMKDIQGQYLGLMLYSTDALSWIMNLVSCGKHDVDTMDMTTLIRLLINGGYPISSMAIHGGWCEIDTPTDLVLANRLYAEGRLKLDV